MILITTGANLPASTLFWINVGFLAQVYAFIKLIYRCSQRFSMKKLLWKRRWLAIENSGAHWLYDKWWYMMIWMGLSLLLSLWYCKEKDDFIFDKYCSLQLQSVSSYQCINMMICFKICLYFFIAKCTNRYVKQKTHLPPAGRRHLQVKVNHNTLSILNILVRRCCGHITPQTPALFEMHHMCPSFSSIAHFMAP